MLGLSSCAYSSPFRSAVLWIACDDSGGSVLSRKFPIAFALLAGEKVETRGVDHSDSPVAVAEEFVRRKIVLVVGTCDRP